MGLGPLTSEPSLHHRVLVPRIAAVLPRVTLWGIFCLHVKVLACLPVNTLKSGAHLVLCPPCCYTGNTVTLWRSTERAMNLPTPYHTVLPNAEIKGWEEGRKLGRGRGCVRGYPELPPLCPEDVPKRVWVPPQHSWSPQLGVG